VQGKGLKGRQQAKGPHRGKEKGVKEIRCNQAATLFFLEKNKIKHASKDIGKRVLIFSKSFVVLDCFLGFPC